MYSLPEQDHVLQVKPHPFGWLMSHLCSSSCLHPQPPPPTRNCWAVPPGQDPSDVGSRIHAGKQEHNSIVFSSFPCAHAFMDQSAMML